jgi:hypothetical protein
MYKVEIARLCGIAARAVANASIRERRDSGKLPASLVPQQPSQYLNARPDKGDSGAFGQLTNCHELDLAAQLSSIDSSSASPARRFAGRFVGSSTLPPLRRRETRAIIGIGRCARAALHTVALFGAV